MNNFSWVIENEIAGMARPHGRDEGLWPWLAEKGVRLVVSLTATPPESGSIAHAGIDVLHIPIEDFEPPAPDDIDKFLSTARFYRHEGKGIVVHCGAGVGRTGTMIACYLVDQGMTPDEAIELVRRKRPGSIETLDQEQAVRELARRKRAS